MRVDVTSEVNIRREDERLQPKICLGVTKFTGKKFTGPYLNTGGQVGLNGLWKLYYSFREAPAMDGP